MNLPLVFHGRATSEAGISSKWNAQSPTGDLACAIPPEFEGPGGGYSPEDLFVQALTNCFIATLKVYVEKSKLSFQNIDVQSELIVDKGESGRPVMHTCRLKVDITGCDKPERIRTLAQKAIENGFVLNSVKTKLEFEISAT